MNLCRGLSLCKDVWVNYICTARTGQDRWQILFLDMINIRIHLLFYLCIMIKNAHSDTLNATSRYVLLVFKMSNYYREMNDFLIVF